jgi:hypothetical protein
VEVAGSGGGSLVAKYMEFTATGSQTTVAHNLGVIPICVSVWPIVFSSSTAVDSELYTAIAFNSTVGDLMAFREGDAYYGTATYWNTTTGKPMRASQNYPIENTGTSQVYITNATSTSILIGGKFSLKLAPNKNYGLWLVGYQVTE